MAKKKIFDLPNTSGFDQISGDFLFGDAIATIKKLLEQQLSSETTSWYLLNYKLHFTCVYVCPFVGGIFYFDSRGGKMTLIKN